MATKVYIHVGPFKTGTTFLQQVLDANRETLAEHGVLVPAGGTKRQAAVAADVIGVPAESGTDRPTWEQLAAEVQQWSGPTAIVSAEFLSRARRQHVTRMVKALAPHEVHVVFMARDLSRVLPAMWQTVMRTGQSCSWRAYVDAVRAHAEGRTWSLSRTGERFWFTHDPREVLGRWSGVVPPERIHVVTVPRAGTDASVLWNRFCSVVGLEPGVCSLDVRRMNESLGTAEAELLRRINAKVAGGMSRSTYNRWVKWFVARRVLEPRAGQRRFALPDSELDWLRPRAQEIVEFLGGGGFHVVGDLDEVLPAPAPGGAVAPDDVQPEEVLEAAVDVVAALLGQVDRRGGRTRRTVTRRDVAAAADVALSGVRRARAARGRRTGRRARWRSRH